MYSKIIARDQWLVASRLYRVAVTRPRVTCRRYIIPLFRRRPPGLHKPYKREERKALNNHATYVLVQTQTSHYRLVPCSSLLADPAHGETPPPLDCHPEVVKTCADAICTGPRSNEVMKYEEKRREERRNRRKECPIDYFPPVPSSKTLLTHFHRSRASDLNSSLSSLSNSYSIRLAIQYRTHSSYHLGVGLCRNR